MPAGDASLKTAWVNQKIPLTVTTVSTATNEWFRYASKWERIWRESLKERPMRPPHQLRLAISAVTDEPVSGKNATENAASAVALLTTAIVKKTISTIADDDDHFVAGIFVFVFSDYFTLVLPGNFEEASTLAMMKVLGIEEFHRGFDTIQESFNELVRSRPKILQGICKACEAWFKNPGESEFERLVELFKIARTHVAQK